MYPTPNRAPVIGLFGIGLDAYWPQFPGLREKLLGNLDLVARRLQLPGVEVLNLGLIDTPQAAQRAGEVFRKADVELVVLYVTTYALSSTVLPVVRQLGVPVLVLNIQPEAAIDYDRFNQLGDRAKMTGIWLEFCSSCPVPEIASVFRRAGIDFHEIPGLLDAADPCWAELAAWVEAARVAWVMARNRLGVMGHYYGGMLDIYSDLTQHLITFGGHIEILEVDALSALASGVGAEEIAAKRREFATAFDIQPGCGEGDLDAAARTSVALDRMVAENQLGSLAYYYQGTGNAANADTLASIIPGTSLLTARGVPVAGEYEIKNVQAMKILDTLGVGGSFTEYYAMDFRDEVILMGHDGPGHLAIAEGRIKLRPLGVYHGKVGRGVSVEMSVRHGPVTLLSVVQGEGGKLELLFAEGESVPGPILEIGNTNSRYRFPLPIREFVRAWNRRGPAHHCAVGIGHVAATLEKLGKIIGIPTTRVC